jgi:hypothetical protein
MSGARLIHSMAPAPYPGRHAREEILLPAASCLDTLYINTVLTNRENPHRFGPAAEGQAVTIRCALQNG